VWCNQIWCPCAPSGQPYSCLCATYVLFAQDLPCKTAADTDAIKRATLDCGGGCECTIPPSVDTQGVITQGTYGSTERCWWTIYSNAIISLQFTFFETESDVDIVYVYACSTLECYSNERVDLATLTGTASQYVNTTRGCRLIFTCDRPHSKPSWRGLQVLRYWYTHFSRWGRTIEGVIQAYILIQKSGVFIKE